jgi:tetratricopeptide (TPR) repeat protein
MHKNKKTAWVVLLSLGGVAASGQQAGQGRAAAGQNADRASAYYYYTLAHMYAELAGAYGNRGDYVNRAIENYKLAIKADPKTPMLSEELSELYIQAGRLREAQNDAEEALKQNQNDLAARRLLARIFTRQIGDSQQNKIDEAMLRKAIEQYQKITELDPKDLDSWVMLGRLHKVAQNSVEAEKAYKKVLDTDPANEDALTGLAMVYGDLGDNKKAVELLKQLADKNPTSRSLQALAGAYEQMREFGPAAETLRRALELNPANATDVKRAMAQDLLFAEQFPAALKVYEELVAEDPSDASSYLRMSQIYRQQRDFAKAREASDKARSIEPTNLEIRYNEVSILEAEGKTPQAIQLLKDILSGSAKRSYNQAERASRVGLLERLARLNRSIDQVDAAVDAFRQMVDLDPQLGPRAEAEIIDAYRAGKQFSKAEQEADAAIKKSPSDRTLVMVRATLLADMGKIDAAAADVKKLLNGKDDRQTQMSLAEIYEKGKRWNDTAKALDAAEKLSESQQDKVDIWFMRGAMLEKQKKLDASEAEFRKVLAAVPDHASALNYLGFMLADRNIRLQESLDMINKALEKEPNNGAYLDSLGWVLFRLGRLPEAEENIRRALEYVPLDPSIHDHMGDILMKQAKVKEAIAQWEASLKQWESSAPTEQEPAEIAKVKSKLESAKVRLAKEGSPNQNRQ